MKKLLSTSFLAMIICLLLQTSAIAQHDTKIGVGLAYDSFAESPGIQVNAVFRVSERLALAPNLTYYFTDEDEGPFLDKYLAINLDGQFMLTLDPEYHIYALAGLNITSYGNEDADIDESELGLNLGIGGEYHLDNFSLFSDLKYVFSSEPLDRVVLAVGVRFPI